MQGNRTQCSEERSDTAKELEFVLRPSVEVVLQPKGLFGVRAYLVTLVVWLGLGSGGLEVSLVPEVHRVDLSHARGQAQGTDRGQGSLIA